MADIEFFLSDEPPGELGQREEIGGEPPARAPLAVHWPTVAAVVLLAGAAALPVIAAFQDVYTVRRGGGRGPVLLSTDGWGRYQQRGVPAGIHEARFGTALTACAGVLALSCLALASAVVPAVKRRFGRLDRVVVTVVSVTSGTLGGVLAAMALHVQSVFDALRAEFSANPQFGSRAAGVDTSIGGCLWLGLAGLAAAVTAAVTVLVGRARSAAAEVPGKLG